MARRLIPQVFLFAGCSTLPMGDAGLPIIDAGSTDASVITTDAGSGDGGTDAGRDAGQRFDAGCALPSDFPTDAPQYVIEAACSCVMPDGSASTLFHCFEENGPRCPSWACPPARAPDGGYEWQPNDAGVVCLC